MPPVHIVRIKPSDLLERLLGEKKFVIRVGKLHLVPNYAISIFTKGDIITYMGSGINQCKIGIIRSRDKDIFGIRVLPQAHETDDGKWETIHEADIVCLLRPYKQEKKLWRLYMEETGPTGTIVQTTITVKRDKMELKTRQKNLESLSQQYNHSYTYHIEEVSSV